jgi:hypothetical protein
VFIRSLLVYTSSYPACRRTLGRQSTKAIWSRGECTPPSLHLVIALCLMKEKRQDELYYVGLGIPCVAMSAVRSRRLRSSFPVFIMT